MDDGTAQIWDLARRAPLHVLNQTTDRSERENRIATSVFSPDGRHILTTQLGAGVWLWNATSRARIALEDSGPISSAVFSPDGRYILAIHAAGGASLWSADGYARIARLERSESISHAAFSPDGKRILGVAERSLLIWETENPASIVARASADGGIGSPRLSSDGQRVVWIGANNTVRMWVAAAGGDITVVGRHRDRVRTAEFSPDGRFIVTSSDDGTARIWDGTDGAVRVLRGHTGEICPRHFPRTASGSSAPRRRYRPHMECDDRCPAGYEADRAAQGGGLLSRRAAAGHCIERHDRSRVGHGQRCTADRAARTRGARRGGRNLI